MRRKKSIKKYKIAKNINYKIKGSKPIFVTSLGNLPQNYIPELKLRYNKGKLGTAQVTSSKHAADFLRTIFSKNTIELQEQFIVLYLNKQNQIIGYYKHTIGAIDGTIVDPRIVFSTALKSLSSAIILCHNHPSGALKASNEDIKLTGKIKEGARLLDINLLDHIILTRNGYFSFTDEGLL